MHSNLARHLHTDECVKYIDQFEACNKEYPYLKYLGFCTDIHNKLSTCVQNELKKRRNQGSENSKKRDLEHYMKTNPKLAEKVRYLEELKAAKEKEDEQQQKHQQKQAKE